LAGADAHASRTAVKNVQLVAKLTGADSINKTDAVGVGGTDLGHMVNHKGKTYFIFGDTFSTAFPNDCNVPGAGCFRSNVVAYSTDTTPADGITFDGWLTGTSVCGHSGWAREVVATSLFPNSTITEIPTGAVSIGDRIYSWYMSVNWWGPPGIWTANYAGLAYWEVGDATFTVVSGFQFPANSNFGMVAGSFRTDLPAGQDDHLYLWGTPPGRLGGVKLARVEPNAVEKLSAYEYFGGLDAAGQPTWGSDEFKAPLVVAPMVGEMSVMYNPAVGAWTMAYLNPLANALQLRESPTPWGPWSAPLTITTGTQFFGLYGSYMNPLYVGNTGKTIYFTMSRWCPYNVWLVRADLDINVVLHLPDLSVDLGDLLIPPPPIAWTGPLGRVDVVFARPADEPVRYDQATLTATPDADAEFSRWEGDVPEGHEDDNPLVLELTQDPNITPVFTEAPPNGGTPCCTAASAALLVLGGIALLLGHRRRSDATTGSADSSRYRA